MLLSSTCTFGRVTNRILLALVACIIVVGVASKVQAQPAGVGDAVAAALYDRGMVLFETGDYGNAKKMYVESLERSPKGDHSADALRMLRSCNEKLGIKDLEEGRPELPADVPLDPYGDPEDLDEQPLDPYADPVEGPLDPYADVKPEGDPLIPPPQAKDDSSVLAVPTFMAWGGVYGLLTGLTLGGPIGDDGDVTGGAVVAGILGAGAGVGLAYWFDQKVSFSGGQYAAMTSAAAWGTLNVGLLGDVFSGDDSDTNTIYRYLTLGGAMGLGAGYWYAKEYKPSEEKISFINSLSLYGTTAGLLLGVAIDPPRSEAYSLNAVLGSGVGLGAGFYFADSVTVTRKRMLKVDVGAAAGAAATWILLYPLLSDDTTNNDEQVAGFVSTLTMFGGAYAGWYLSRNDVKSGAPPPRYPAAPALVQRHGGDSGWSLGTPMLRPMELPALAPREGLSLGVDVVGARF